LFSGAVKVTGDEKKIMAIVARDGWSLGTWGLGLGIGCFNPFLLSCLPYFNFGSRLSFVPFCV